jgi:hypothetical protein
MVTHLFPFFKFERKSGVQRKNIEENEKRYYSLFYESDAIFLRSQDKNLNFSLRQLWSQKYKNCFFSFPRNWVKTENVQFTIFSPATYVKEVAWWNILISYQDLNLIEKLNTLHFKNSTIFSSSILTQIIEEICF